MALNSSITFIITHLGNYLEWRQGYPLYGREDKEPIWWIESGTMVPRSPITIKTIKVNSSEEKWLAGSDSNGGTTEETDMFVSNKIPVWVGRNLSDSR